MGVAIDKVSGFKLLKKTSHPMSKIFYFFSIWLLCVLGAMLYCQVSSACVCSRIALVTMALRWFIVLTRSVCYLGNHVAKAMWRHDVRRGCSLKELSTKTMQGCVVVRVRF